MRREKKIAGSIVNIGSMSAQSRPAPSSPPIVRQKGALATLTENTAYGGGCATASAVNGL